MRNYKSTVILSLLAITLISPVQAQEDMRLDDIFRWFPEGDYDYITYYNREVFEEKCPDDLEERYFNSKILHRDPDTLPESLKSQYSSITTARLVRFKRDKYDEERQKKQEDSLGSYGFVTGNISYYLNEEHSVLEVYTFIDAGSLMRQAARDGDVERAEGKRINKRPVYRFKSWSGEKFAYVADADVLIVASEALLIARMFQAGSTGDSPLLNSDDFYELGEMAPVIGEDWTYVNDRCKHKHLYNYLVDINPQSSMLGEMKEHMKLNLQGSVMANKWNEKGEWEHRCINIFGSEEKAEESFDEFARSFKLYDPKVEKLKARRKLEKLKKEARTLELRDKMVVEISIDNKEKLLQHKRLLGVTEKIMDKKQKKKEKELEKE